MNAHTRDAATRLREASDVRPSARQLAWQGLEFYGFVHFGMNTMTDREWGIGHEDPSLFDPSDVDADQWVRAAKSAGMRALILTCKHHDGFCLWPSAQTSHTVAASPWRQGAGDLVAEVAEACARHGLKFGVYLSPWDRTEPSYGSGTAYDDFFVAQLTELLTGYGPVFCVWLDGANGEGPDGRRQYYDWDRYYEVIRRLQPDAVICVCGPDVRWCGNEAGDTRPDEWSVVPASLRDAELTASRSQQVDDGEFSRQVRSDEDDLGSREVILASTDPLVWYPAEVNTSIRPGWFHHPAEDDQVRTADELFEIYRRSVGGNGSFLLNLPPDRAGRIGPNDVRELDRLGRLIADIADRDVAASASVRLSDPAAPIPRGDRESVWTSTGTDATPAITLTFPSPVEISGLVAGEDVSRGQQIEQLRVTGVTADRERVELAVVRSVGHQRIIDLDPVTVTELTLTVTATRGPIAVDLLRVLAHRPLP